MAVNILLIKQTRLESHAKSLLGILKFSWKLFCFLKYRKCYGIPDILLRNHEVFIKKIYIAIDENFKDITEKYAN